ncbi:glycosyltransferase [Botrimarina sp.]|uniref:glycosyltransferase n=1 Tax=Botrimarina sp. TaxID=2795802 RepID=UPI0032EAA4F7
MSVAICTWNRADLLDKTLRRMASMRVPESVSWELIVVDNNCTDHTQQVLQRHVGALPLRIVTESQPGLSYARNRAIEVSQAEIILWTDDDVLVDEHWLTETLAAMRGLDAEVCFGSVHPWWETAAPPWFGDCLAGRFALYDRGRGAHLLSEAGQSGYGANHAVARSVYQRLGGYRTDLGVVGDKGGGGEDTELVMRAIAAGVRTAYAGSASVRHFIPAERCRKRYFRRRQWRGGSSQYRMLTQAGGGRRTILGLPAYMYRQHTREMVAWLFSNIRADRARAFQAELKLISFASLLRTAVFARYDTCTGKRGKQNPATDVNYQSPETLSEGPGDLKSVSHIRPLSASDARRG